MIQEPESLRLFLINACKEKVEDILSTDWMISNIYDPKKYFKHIKNDRNGFHVCVTIEMSKSIVMNKDCHIENIIFTRLMTSTYQYAIRRKITFNGITSEIDIEAIPHPKREEAIRIRCHFLAKFMRDATVA